MRTRTISTTTAVFAAATLIGIGANAPVAGAAGVTVHPGTSPSVAADNLAGLTVDDSGPSSDYDRDAFGPAWTDDVSVPGGGNGCSTREDILERDLTDPVLSDDCQVESGTLDDQYTGRTVEFVRGPDTSADVQIDHVVALSDAWQRGADSWTAAKRADFANDPRNLWAADGPANQAKGDSNAAEWVPENAAFRCTYATAQIDVKASYDLAVTADEKAALEGLLETC